MWSNNLFACNNTQHNFFILPIQEAVSNQLDRKYVCENILSILEAFKHQNKICSVISHGVHF